DDRDRAEIVAGVIEGDVVAGSVENGRSGDGETAGTAVVDCATKRSDLQRTPDRACAGADEVDEARSGDGQSTVHRNIAEVDAAEAVINNDISAAIDNDCIEVIVVAHKDVVARAGCECGRATHNQSVKCLSNPSSGDVRVSTNVIEVIPREGNGAP